MKISVCIPVYNFDVRELVYDLKKEIQNNLIDAEIILIDDASDEKFKHINNELLNQVKEFILLEKNVGRSKIRNLFLKHTDGDYLLFLDCDVKIDNGNFLKNYLKEIQRNRGVEAVYGNFRIDSAYSKTLRNRYSVEKEIFSVEKSSNFSLLKTVNFIIKKDVFEKFSFNEDLVNYGYEDFVFAKTLEFGNVKFSAIQNPVIHIDDTSNEVFLKKTEIAIHSLYQLYQNSENELFIKDIKVFKVAKKIIKAGLKNVFLNFYTLIETRIKKNLLSENPNLNYLDLFKLGLLLKKIK
ncbi:glycosyltransferase family 2 protein [Chryseobacterium luquanense]|uniref:Glycosyltransferase family 2 protein n=1 Tax=Chryseobacterium luquanense TaxID=2983766 RepID=A0ABT3Y5I9_9FLAO|nr:glycosyltransferase [Chryseobacterium luquanense]MCX8533359.1 glycosyltransferase family 2 protein [Chryseobacterium luquanense]